MAMGISKTQGIINVKLDDGEIRGFKYADLKQMVLNNQIFIENMYINELGHLCFIRSKDNDNARKYMQAETSGASNSRRAGWHSGGSRKPYGFLHQ
ncbi:MAG: hypothetical protein J6A59_03920 [Lachnospiraceae bacterium]|nr:hypothetical protein [Lachnospiraceae bacterium]